MNRIENLYTGMICAEDSKLTYLETSSVQDMSLKISKIKRFIIALIKNGVKFKQNEKKVLLVTIVGCTNINNLDT